MGVLGDIRGFVGGSGSVFFIIALAVADHLWGENVFNCPCGDLTTVYTFTFFVVPPVVIVMIGIMVTELTFARFQTISSHLTFLISFIQGLFIFCDFRLLLSEIQITKFVLSLSLSLFNRRHTFSRLSLLQLHPHSSPYLI